MKKTIGTFLVTCVAIAFISSAPIIPTSSIDESKQGIVEHVEFYKETKKQSINTLISNNISNTFKLGKTFEDESIKPLNKDSHFVNELRVK